MNGQPLPREHGFPARLLVPGRYGMKNPKWLAGIRAMNQEYQGWYEQRGWNKDGIIKTMSRIDVPVDGAMLDRRRAAPGRHRLRRRPRRQSRRLQHRRRRDLAPTQLLEPMPARTPWFAGRARSCCPLGQTDDHHPRHRRQRRRADRRVSAAPARRRLRARLDHGQRGVAAHCSHCGAALALPRTWVPASLRSLLCGCRGKETPASSALSRSSAAPCSLRRRACATSLPASLRLLLCGFKWKGGTGPAPRSGTPPQRSAAPQKKHARPRSPRRFACSFADSSGKEAPGSFCGAALLCGAVLPCGAACATSLPTSLRSPLCGFKWKRRQISTAVPRSSAAPYPRPRRPRRSARSFADSGGHWETQASRAVARSSAVPRPRPRSSAVPRFRVRDVSSPRCFARSAYFRSLYFSGAGRTELGWQTEHVGIKVGSTNAE